MKWYIYLDDSQHCIGVVLLFLVLLFSSIIIVWNIKSQTVGNYDKINMKLAFSVWLIRLKIASLNIWKPWPKRIIITIFCCLFHRLPIQLSANSMLFLQEMNFPHLPFAHRLRHSNGNNCVDRITETFKSNRSGISISVLNAQCLIVESTPSPKYR